MSPNVRKGGVRSCSAPHFARAAGASLEGQMNVTRGIVLVTSGLLFLLIALIVITEQFVDVLGRLFFG
jgi:hypothetical protein